eukprot:5573981-Lingulodinium_polyedra.AAC.1
MTPFANKNGANLSSHHASLLLRHLGLVPIKVRGVGSGAGAGGSARIAHNTQHTSYSPSLPKTERAVRR